MNKYLKSVLLWLFAIVFTIAAVIYQRTTGPTYPVNDEVEINGNIVEYELIRSEEISDKQYTIMKIKAPEPIIGKYKYRRVSSFDEWTEKSMIRSGDSLALKLPQLKELAGKYEYQVMLGTEDNFTDLTEEPIRIRYKGAVPDFVLWPHIILMFLAMLFSTRTLVAAIAKEQKSTMIYTQITIITLFIGGLILGPLVQKYAFDAYWTGWPFGTDLTDNKTIVAFLFWALAYFMLRKNSKKYIYPIIAGIILLAVYSIPHSAMGSEYDYKKNTSNTEVSSIQSE